MKKLLCLLLPLLLLTGCAGRIELALMAVCLGVDVDAAGVTLTVKSPDYTGEKKEQEKGYATLSVRGGDWGQAVAALYAQSPAAPQFGQLREIVISESSFAYLPPQRLLRCVDQLPSLRAHALVTVCPGSAADAVAAMTPGIGKRLSKYLDISLAHFEDQGILPATSLSSALRDLGGPWRDPVLAYAGDNGGGYAIGTAGTLILTGREVQLLRLMKGESQDYLLSFGGGHYGVSLRGRAACRAADDALTLALPVYLTYSLYSDPPAPGAEQALQAEIEALLARLQGIGCDALGFGCQAVRNYPTLPAWLQSDWPQRYRQAAIRVDVQAQARQQPIF